jgi:hypothetical protein
VTPVLLLDTQLDGFAVGVNAEMLLKAGLNTAAGTVIGFAAFQFPQGRRDYVVEMLLAHRKPQRRALGRALPCVILTVEAAMTDM